jgi:hypothetical protein
VGVSLLPSVELVDPESDDCGSEVAESSDCGSVESESEVSLSSGVVIVESFFSGVYDSSMTSAVAAGVLVFFADDFVWRPLPFADFFEASEAFVSPQREPNEP